MRLIDADALIDTLGISDEEIDFKEILREAPTIEAVSIDDYRSMENTCYKLQKALYEMADRKTEPQIEYCPRCGMRILVDKPKTEPTGDNLSAVEYEPKSEEYEEPNYYDPALWE